LKKTFLIFLSLVIALPAWSIDVDEVQERRTRGGLRLFRAILAADEDIASKTGPEGTLLLTVLHSQNSGVAEKFAEELRTLGKGNKQGKIRKVPIEVEVSNDLSLATYTDRKPAGFFLVEDLRDDDLDRVVKYGIDNSVIVYSPFEGDVDRGVLGGLAIETRVRPYINLQTMRDSQIRIKAFFLKVAKHYDP
jgi:hypothetical protein